MRPVIPLWSGILLVALGYIAAVCPAAAQVPPLPFTRTLTVTGTGRVSVRPDMAQVSAGVVSHGATAAAALADNSRLMRQILEGLAAFGIPEADVQTSQVAIVPQYERGPAPGRLIGYQVSNQVSITVRELERLGELLDRLVRLGANRLQGVQFAVSNPQSLLDRARAAAVREARRKAELISQAAGVTLGQVLSIEEQGPALPRPLAAMRAEAAAGVPIAPGEEMLSVTVTVVFALQ
ncbi:MAG: SIMPL domain-containing protein [Candidatus Tectimicrobiota bacterium]|nr:MAG: SIMPL domain-containing protein [Candidatus Tectomicrobia bacterium]